MIKKVAKCYSQALRNSRVEVLKRMAPNNSQSEFKYLTLEQMRFVESMGISTMRLTKEESSIVNKEIPKGKKVEKPSVKDIHVKKVILTCKSEGEEYEVTFCSESEASEYIRDMEARICSGEDFEVINKEIIR